MSIRPALDALAHTLERLDLPLASQFAGGLDAETVTAKLSAIPGRVAAEVHDYFAWRNGLRDDRTRDEELFPEAVPLSLDEVLSDYRALCDVASQVSQQAGVPASTIWDATWVPLFRHPAGGAYYVTVAAAMPGDHAPILAVTPQDATAASIVFDSLASLVKTVNECYATGAFAVEDGMIREDRQRAAAIARAYNRLLGDDAIPWIRPNN